MFGRRFSVAVAVAILVALFVVGCGSPTANSSTQVPPTRSAAKPTEAPMKMYKVGDTVNVANTWQITVTKTKVVDPHFDTFQGQDQIRNHQQFLVTYLKVRNISATAQTLDKSQLRLQDSDGNSNFSTTMLYDYNNRNNTLGDGIGGTIEPNMQQQGSLVYIIPLTTHTFYLSFETDFNAQGQTLWEITVK
jgi:hypothetical protein